MTPRNQITNSMSMRSGFKTAKLQNFYNEKKFQKSPGNLQNPEIPKEKKFKNDPEIGEKLKTFEIIFHHPVDVAIGCLPFNSR